MDIRLLASVTDKVLMLSRVLRALFFCSAWILLGCAEEQTEAPPLPKTDPQVLPLGQSPCGEEDFYASTTGLPSGTGSIEAPWDLVTALTKVEKVTGGKNICLRGGTYRSLDRNPGAKGFYIRLKGYAGSRITIKPYDGERVVIDGGLQSDDDDRPEHLVIYGLEVIVSENLTESRVSAYSGSAPPPDLLRPWGGIDIRSGDDIHIVNNQIHDNMQGIGLGGRVSGNSSIYGNVIYHNGWIAPDRNHGQGIYTQNSTSEWKFIQNNILFDNYSLNMQAYGSIAVRVDRYHVSDNLYYGGSHTDNGGILIGGETPSQTVRVYNNAGTDASFRVGYVDGGDDAIVHGNWIWGDLSWKTFTNFFTSDNLSWQDGWAKPRIDGVEVPVPGSIQVFLNPNIYNTHRAHLGLMNFPLKATEALDLSSFLSVGQMYQFFDPLDETEPVLKGTFDGRPITVPLKGKLTVYILERSF